MGRCLQKSAYFLLLNPQGLGNLYMPSNCLLHIGTSLCGRQGHAIKKLLATCMPSAKCTLHFGEKKGVPHELDTHLGQSRKPVLWVASRLLGRGVLSGKSQPNHTGLLSNDSQFQPVLFYSPPVFTCGWRHTEVKSALLTWACADVVLCEHYFSSERRWSKGYHEAVTQHRKFCTVTFLWRHSEIWGQNIWDNETMIG